MEGLMLRLLLAQREIYRYFHVPPNYRTERQAHIPRDICFHARGNLTLLIVYRV